MNIVRIIGILESFTFAWIQKLEPKRLLLFTLFPTTGPLQLDLEPFLLVSQMFLLL